MPQIAVQSIHSAIDATKSFPQPQKTCSVVLCTLPVNELELFMLKLEREGIKYCSFYEPDIGNVLTSIATEPVYGTQRKVFKKLKMLKGG